MKEEGKFVFEWNGKELSSYTDIIDTALSLEKKKQAEFVAKFFKQWPNARSNIGYISGYYSSETAARILEIFDTSHPIFGTTRPSPEEAFEAGKKLGESIRKNKL